MGAVTDLELRYKTMSAVVHYAMDDTLVARLQEAIKGQRDEHLNLNVSASRPDQLAFQSITGSTTANVQRQHARMQTTYFGDFERASFGADRLEYAKAKLGRLLDLLAKRAGAKLAFFGAVVEAHIEAPPGTEDALRSVLTRVLQISPLLTPPEGVFDLSFRTSTPKSDDVFANTSVGWFTSRGFAFEVGPDSLPKPVINEWDMQLIAQGVELKYDQNNKRGLFRGRSDWSTDDFMAMACATLEDSKTVFGKIESAIADANSVGGGGS